jgi:AbrB family looped-hinge helix DNA binding protein
MALIKLRRFAQLTLPSEVRKHFYLTEGDYLEVQSTKSGILLKPVSVVDRAAAWKDVAKVLKQVHAQQPTRKRSAREEEEWIAQEVKAHRKAKRSTKHAA